MKIGIDIRQLIFGVSGGISQLVQGVCEHMFLMYPEHHFSVFCTPFNRRIFGNEADNVRYFSLPILNYFEEIDRILIEQDIEILFRAYPAEYDTLEFPLNKQIYLIPDNQHEIYPDFFTTDTIKSRRVAFSRALDGAGAIGTISEFASKALQEYSSKKSTDIFLMSPALQHSHKHVDINLNLSDEERLLIPKCEFFIFPANLWKHKNHKRMLDAFRLFLKKNKSQVQFIFTGHPEGWAELYSEYSELPIHHLGFVRPELLRILLERSCALVYFSLYEGFGIPLLEAFDAGTPVICSNTTSLPEVGGNAVLMCSPTDIEAMASLMERIIVDGDLRASLVQRGKEQLDNYSWEKSAHNLVNACKRVNQKELYKNHGNLKPDYLPLVSIVTPSFNQGKFLKRTIDSVLSQSYPNIEYIVIDGGSTDESIDVLKSYGNKFQWVSEKDDGQTDAINKGMRRSHGQILAYLNSDDVLLPGAIQSVVEFFKSHPNCGLLYGNADYVDVNDNYISSYKTAPYSFQRLIQDCMVCQPAAFWRQSVREKIGDFDQQLNFVMDYDYWMRIAKSGCEIIFLQQKLANSRLYPETKTLSYRAKIFEEIFQISMKHAGYIHYIHYQGLWHYRIYENPLTSSLFIQISRYIPGIHLVIGWLHCKWAHRYLLIKSLFLTKQIRKFIRASTKQYKSDTAKKISGFYLDNWISNKFIYLSANIEIGKIFYIKGRAVKDLVASVYIDHKLIMSQEIYANKESNINFFIDQLPCNKLKILFSDFVKEPTGRRLAFYLTDTNIFSEQDLR